MDFLLDILSFENIVLGFVGILGIVGFVAASRAMRKGRQSYDERHEAMDERIKQTAQSIRDDNNSMHGYEQLHIVALALRDALQQKGHFAQDIIVEHADHLSLHLSKGIFTVHYKAKLTTLHSTNKTVYGQGLWEVYQDGNIIQSFVKLVQLERYLLWQLHDAGY